MDGSIVNQQTSAYSLKKLDITTQNSVPFLKVCTNVCCIGCSSLVFVPTSRTCSVQWMDVHPSALRKLWCLDFRCHIFRRTSPLKFQERCIYKSLWSLASFSGDYSELQDRNLLFLIILASLSDTSKTKCYQAWYPDVQSLWSGSVRGRIIFSWQKNRLLIHAKALAIF